MLDFLSFANELNVRAVLCELCIVHGSVKYAVHVSYVRDRVLVVHSAQFCKIC